MKKIVLFDFDGVIVDTFESSFQIALAENPTWTREQEKKLFEGNIYEEIGKLKESGAGFVEDEKEFFKQYTAKLFDIPPVKGMADVIEALAKIYQLVVVSSTISSPIQGYLDMHNLDRHFGWVMGRDIHASKVEKIKMVFKEYKVKPEDCVFITDTLGDMKEANKCNVGVIGITWGFHEQERLEKGEVFKIIDRVEQIVPTVQEFFARST